MRVTVVPVGLIKKYVRASTVDTTEGTTSRRLIESLGIPRELKMASYVNGKKRPLDEPLVEGDEVKLVTLLTGG